MNRACHVIYTWHGSNEREAASFGLKSEYIPSDYVWTWHIPEKKRK